MADKVAPYSLNALITGQTGETPAQAGGGLFDDIPMAKPSVAEDVAKTVPAGLTRGTAGVLGMPADLMNAVDHTWQWLVAKGLEKAGVLTPEQAERAQEPLTPFEQDAQYGRMGLPTSKLVVDATEKAVGPLYKPQTVAGEYANTAAEFAPGMIMGSGSTLQRLGQTFVPAAVSETAGQLTKGTVYEPVARATGALVGGVGVALKQNPSTAQSVLSAHMNHVDDAALTAAGKLMEEAYARGVPLTWPEAIAHVTGNGTSLTTLQRFVEGSKKGGEVMGGFMSQRPDQVEQAGRAAFSEIAPTITNPSSIGPEIRRAAQGTIDDVQGAIDTATRPAYDAAKAMTVHPEAYAGLLEDPLYLQTLKEVRSDASLNRTIAALPDEAVGTVDLVQRRMQEAADNARLPGQASTSNLRAANFTDARSPAIEAAEAATGGPTGFYASAQAAEAELRSKYLQPLMDGPIGTLAEKDTTTRTAIEALFPSNPLPGSAEEVGQAVSALVKTRPAVAERLVRAHVESVFNAATKKTVAGKNEWGGASFAAKLVGNSEQAATLEAAVRALPNGDVRWDGFDKLLNILEATGKRQKMGSSPVSNRQIEEAMRSGGTVGEAISLMAGGSNKLLERLLQAYGRYRLGENTSELAQIISDPKALPLLRQLAKESPTSSKAAFLALRLTYLGKQGYQSESNEIPSSR